MTKKIREELQKGPLSAAAVAERLGVQTYAAQRRVREALRQLARRGEAVADRSGPETVWRLAGSREATVQEKLWRALGLRAAQGQEVTVREAALLAEASRDYSKRYLSWLWRQGWLEKAGRGRYRWPPEKTWREAERPHWCRKLEEERAVPARGRPQALEAVEDNLARAMAYLEEAQVGLMEYLQRRRQEAGDGGGADPA
jgi:hypothetical protein